MGELGEFCRLSSHRLPSVDFFIDHDDIIIERWMTAKLKQGAIQPAF
jgi:hypothetical protein